jgi:hypothetical protein
MSMIVRAWQKGFWLASRSWARRRPNGFGRRKRRGACRNTAQAVLALLGLSR